MVIAEKELKGEALGRNRESISFPEYELEIPVYDIRSLSDQEQIAREIARGRQMAMFGGVWGGFQGIQGLSGDTGEYLKWAKKDRPKEAKYVVMKPPRSSHELIDWSKVHEDLRFLEDPDSFEALWETHGAYLHVIAPVKDGLLPSALVTSPEEHEKAYPGRPSISADTSAFLWRADPYFENFARLVDEHSDTQIHIGVTSLNKHGEKPPYTYDEFVAHLRAGNADPRQVHLVVRDSIYENSQALGSHTQLRLPLADEEGVVELYRIGTLSPEGFEKRTGIELRNKYDVKDVRKNPGINVDTHIDLMRDQVQERWRRESEVIFQSE